MPGVDDRDRARRTEVFAARLIKCQARHSVYAERAATTRNPALGYLVDLEAELLREAESDWRAILQHWALLVPSERGRLQAVLRLAKIKALHTARVAFDDKITCEALASFFGAFEPDGLVPRGTT